MSRRSVHCLHHTAAHKYNNAGRITNTPEERRARPTHPTEAEADGALTGDSTSWWCRVGRPRSAPLGSPHRSADCLGLTYGRDFTKTKTRHLRRTNVHTPPYTSTPTHNHRVQDGQAAGPS
ncbi:hypothetical protein E2C01_080397 [Portunus trituberculatus]|uniref:Uncharacterized protein n=1 Tax=Portunus trituberculatus TaxID=210409 RepID=A0A5B7IVB8_PORTR|nr:hypothetical protein [Portunus trituberculatus]